MRPPASASALGFLMLLTIGPWSQAAAQSAPYGYGVVEAVPGYPASAVGSRAPTRIAPPPLPPVPISPLAVAPAVPVAPTTPLIVTVPVGPEGFVGPPVLAAPVYIDPRTGRCLAGFARNHLGICTRLDEPRIVCARGRPAADACGVALPNPAPYGPGAMLRRDY